MNSIYHYIKMTRSIFLGMLIFLSALPCNDTFAQPEVVDSLNEVLNTIKDPKERFETYYLLCYTHLTGFDKESISCGEKLIIMGANIDREHELRAKGLQANIYSNMQKMNKAVSLANEVINDSKDPKALFYSYGVVGENEKRNGNWDSLFLYSKKMFDLAEQNDLKRLKMIPLEDMAIYYAIHDDYKKSDSLFNMSLQASQEVKSTYHIANTYYNLGLLSYNYGYFEKANEYNLKGYPEAKKLPNKSTLIGFINQLARFSFSNQDTVQALQYWEEGVNCIEEHKIKDYRTGELLNHYALRLNEIKDYDKATTIAQKLYQFGLDNSFEFEKTLAASLLAFAHSNIENVEISNKYIDIVLSEIHKFKNNYATTDIYASILTAMLDNGRAEEAIKLVKAYEEIALNLNPDASAKRDFYWIKYLLNKEVNKPKIALEAFENCTQLSDSLTHAMNTKTLLQTKIKFEANEKELLNLSLKEKNEMVQASNDKLLMGLIILLLFLSGIVYLYFKNRKANQLINKQNRNLQSVNATKDRLFAIISHDLRSEVSAFQNLNSILSFHLENKNYDRIKEIVSQVDKSAITVNTLMDNLLQWSSSQLEGITLHPGKLDLKLEAESVLKLFEQYSSTKGVHLNVNLPENLSIFADENSLQFVIRNVISNALKFTETGGEVNITATESSEGIALKIKDSGIGIPKSKLSKLWHIDKKSSRQGTHGERGAGIGLSMVKDFVNRNNGKIHIESEEDNGTTVTILLPKAS